MSEAMSRIAERAAEIRREFDHAFSRPVAFDTAIKEELLGIRVAEQRYAIRLSEIAGLHAGKEITRVPGGDAALCGIAGFRGAVLPVYDLQLILGHPASERPRWLVIAAMVPVGLAFAAFEGQLRVPREDIVSQSGRSDAAGITPEFVRAKNFSGPVLHLPSILDAVKALKRDTRKRSEQK
jgi:purine-binding chemotaxis protein CheW